ncbi:MAG: bifunctional riboflavin kinase/FAD synthetase [Anaerolineales bacterium]|nr:bifunctional riboflavin kinase/FAD synthetase [Anaerolineales bacterium]
MLYYTSIDAVSLKDVWLSIGSFDGVHLGHQEVLKTLTQGAHAQGVQAVILTFYPHPAVVLGRRKDPFYLTTQDEKVALLTAGGVDVVIIQPFDLQLAQTTAHDFMARLHASLGLKHLVVGYDFALGRNREGNVQRLVELGDEFSYQVHVMSPFMLGGEPVSSSRIRKLLVDGNVDQIEALLSRPFRLSGNVVPGDGRGHKLGFPTANLEVWAERAIPASGVYVCRAYVDGAMWGAVTNVGFRPTFDARLDRPIIETHLLGYNQDLYGKSVQLEFIERLRAEKRFSSVDELIDQVNQDIATARERLALRYESVHE